MAGNKKNTTGNEPEKVRFDFEKFLKDLEKRGETPSSFSRSIGRYPGYFTEIKKTGYIRVPDLEYICFRMGHGDDMDYYTLKDPVAPMPDGGAYGSMLAEISTRLDALSRQTGAISENVQKTGENTVSAISACDESADRRTKASEASVISVVSKNSRAIQEKIEDLGTQMSSMSKTINAGFGGIIKKSNENEDGKLSKEMSDNFSKLYLLCADIMTEMKELSLTINSLGQRTKAIEGNIKLLAGSGSERAVLFLKKQLWDGASRKRDELIASAAEYGIQADDVEEAASRLGVYKEKTDSGILWTIPSRR